MPARIRLSFALALLSRVAFAQSPSAALPGVRFTLPRATDTIVYARTVTRSGTDSASGTRTVSMRAIASPGAPATLEVVQRFPGGGGEIVDTALADLSTLRAMAHRSHQPARTMRFTFVGERAQGSVVFLRATGDSTVAVDQAVGAIFDSNIIELVVASLPLRDGYAADVPFFIYERGGRVMMPVTVTGRTSVAFPRLGARDAWVVTVGVPGAPATVWVDATTRAVLRVRYDIAARALAFTDDRVTPLRD